MSDVCRCDGRYDGCEHPRPCPSLPGTRWSLHFCPACDQRRRDHISANLADLAAQFSDT